MVTKENQSTARPIKGCGKDFDKEKFNNILCRVCGETHTDGKIDYCPECKAKNHSQSSGEIVSSQEMSNDIQEKITESPTLNGSLEKSPVYNLQQELQQVEEGCGYSIYIGLENEKCDMQCRKGDLCPACKLKQTYLQKAISALEEKDKEIEEKVKKLKEEYDYFFNGTPEMHTDIDRRILQTVKNKIDKLFGEGK